EMRPGQVARELLEEEARVDRAGAARADVVQVRDLALEVLTVLVDQWELPEPLAGGPGGVEEALGEPGVVRQQTGTERAERDDARAGERRHVDHLVGLDARGGVGERVREREPSLGV